MPGGHWHCPVPHLDGWTDTWTERMDGDSGRLLPSSGILSPPGGGLAAAWPGAVLGAGGAGGRPPRSHHRRAGPYLGQVVLVPQMHPYSGPFCLPPHKGLVPLHPAAAGTHTVTPHLTNPPARTAPHPWHRPSPLAAAWLCQPRAGAGEEGGANVHRRVAMGTWGQGPHPSPPTPVGMLSEGACWRDLLLLWPLSSPMLGHQVPTAPRPGEVGP